MISPELKARLRSMLTPLLKRIGVLLSHRIVIFFVFAVLGLVLLKGLYDLVEMLRFEWEGPMNGDAFIYLTMGRGILNGLKPYVDLLESKPPGIFILFALSLVVTGTERLVAFVEMAFLTLIPTLLGFWAWKRWGKTSSVRGMFAFLLAILIGILLSLRLQQVVGGLQTELFGAFFGLIYVLSILWDEREPGRGRIALAALGIFGAIGMKEPFFLALLASALLICKTPRSFVRCFLVPLALAAVAGLIILFITGFWSGYWHIYLPVMFGNRLMDVTAFPLFIRAIWIVRFFGGFTFFSPMPLLGYILAGCFCLVIAKQARGGRILAPAILVVVSYWLMYVTTLWRINFAMHDAGITDYSQVPQYGETLWTVQILGAGCAVLIGVLLWLSPRTIFTVLRGMAALMLLSLAFGISGYTGNDAGNAFVGLFAIALLALSELGEGAIEGEIAWPVIAALIVAGVILFQPKSLNDRRQEFLGTRENYQAFSAALDTMLTKCGSPPYYYMGSQPAEAYAKHSPIGPVFTPHFSGFLAQDHPLYVTTRRRILETAQVQIEIPVPANKVDAMWVWVRGPFTADVPPCAKGVTFPDGYTVTYRSKENGGALWLN